jgi:hypothetical protein
MNDYNNSVAQLFLHSALNGKRFEEYVFKELLKEKLNLLFVNLDEELEIYERSIGNAEKAITLISRYSQKIPEEARLGVYCHCIQLGIVSIIDNPINDFFLILQSFMGISVEKDSELRKIFSEMMLTFFGYE